MESWVTASILKSPGLFLVFWPTSIMLLFEGSSLVLYLQVLPSLYQSISVCAERADYDRYQRHFHVPLFFQFPSKVQVSISVFGFIQFYHVFSRNNKVHNSTCSFLFYCLSLSSGHLAEIRWSVLISKF